MDQATSDHMQKTLAYYGRAMLRCHALEKQLFILLSSIYGALPRAASVEEYHALFAQRPLKTLGTLVDLYRKTGAVPPTINRKLNRALDIRNFLAHEYFWTRLGCLLNHEARERMIAELDEADGFLDTLRHDLGEVASDWLAENGLEGAHLVVTEGLAEQARADGFVGVEWIPMPGADS